MKAKVLLKYRDKYTGEIHDPGTEIEVTKDRADEILSKGDFIEIISEEKPEKKARTKKTEKK